MELIKAKIKDKALLAEMDNFLSDQNQFHIWWLGQSGFLLQWQGKRILLDPYLSDSLTNKYEHTDKPHTRMSEQVIDPGLFTNIAAVSSSHNHTDHLDAATLQPIIKNNPDIRFIIPEANRNFVAERVNCTTDFPIGLNDGQSFTVEGFQFTGIPAKHNEIDRDEKGHCRYMGFVVSFGPYNIYHSGDTLWFDALPQLLKPFSVDLALLPINGNKPERKVAGNLDCKEAAVLAKTIGAKMVIPCHYDMFSFNTADVHEFMTEAEQIHQPYTVLMGGGRYDSKPVQ
jgi:L-ascorbate metabolism protein UlaG (beta-lactamase superfamily)